MLWVYLIPCGYMVHAACECTGHTTLKGSLKHMNNTTSFLQKQDICQESIMNEIISLCLCGVCVCVCVCVVYNLSKDN